MVETALAFTGHRPHKLDGYLPDTEQNKKMLWQLRHMIEDYINNYNVDTFITGMALGIDMWAGKIVLALKQKYPRIKLICAVPCRNQIAKWWYKDVVMWAEITSQADEVHYVSDQDYTPWCLQARNEWMVDHAKYILGVWDGSSGGTANCIKYAVKKQRDITFMHPKTLEVTKFENMDNF